MNIDIRVDDQVVRKALGEAQKQAPFAISLAVNNVAKDAQSSGDAMGSDRQRIDKGDVGSLEEALGPNDPLFSPADNQSTIEAVARFESAVILRTVTGRDDPTRYLEAEADAEAARQAGRTEG